MKLDEIQNEDLGALKDWDPILDLWKKPSFFVGFFQQENMELPNSGAFAWRAFMLAE